MGGGASKEQLAAAERAKEAAEAAKAAAERKAKEEQQKTQQLQNKLADAQQQLEAAQAVRENSVKAGDGLSRHGQPSPPDAVRIDEEKRLAEEREKIAKEKSMMEKRRRELTALEKQQHEMMESLAKQKADDIRSLEKEYGMPSSKLARRKVLRHFTADVCEEGLAARCWEARTARARDVSCGTSGTRRPVWDVACDVVRDVRVVCDAAESSRARGRHSRHDACLLLHPPSRNPLSAARRPSLGCRALSWPVREATDDVHRCGLSRRLNVASKEP